MNDFDNQNDKMRTDIQVLRGLAVLVVMMYHAGFPFVENGYLGVDIFFVISGFLITRIILTDLDKGCFSFREFYLRRARRLLPAALVVLSFTSLFSSFLLNKHSLLMLGSQILSALSFSTNILFLVDSNNYFGESAELKPLLHFWSLSIEEQFYLIFPVLLVYISAKYRQGLILFLFVMSLGLCFYYVNKYPSFSFYLLPTRAWELLLGGILAISKGIESKGSRSSNFISILLFSLLVYSLSFGFDVVHPRLDALLVCLVTAIFIWKRPRFLSYSIHDKFLKPVGDISYSLYLVHWPLISLANNIFLEKPSLWVYGSLFFISFPLAVLLNKYVEKKFRHKGGFKLQHVLLVALGIFLPIVASIFFFHGHEKNWPILRAANYGFGTQCDYSRDFSFAKNCSNSDSPDVLIWGDSYAMHLVPGLLKENPEIKMAQATRLRCSPNLYIAQVNKFDNLDWAQSCIAFNNSVFDFIKKNSVNYVIMASRLNQFEQNVYDNKNISSLNDKEIAETFIKTIKELEELGVFVVLVAPPPENGSNVGDCLEKSDVGLFFISKISLSNCRIKKEDYLAYQHSIIKMIKKVQAHTHSLIVWPDKYLCSDDYCDVVIDGIPLYRDYGHYTIVGSEAFVPQLGLLNSYKALDLRNNTGQ